MKIVKGKTGLMFRLGALVAAMLLGQQAMAEGTRAGTTIDNTASVAFEVNNIPQTAEASNTVSFVVDRRVDYTLVPVSTPDLEIVNPGQNDAFVDFLLTNTSNSDLDFTLALAQETTGNPVDGSGNDSTDISNLEYAVSLQTVAGGDADPAQLGPQFVDDLAADQAIRIRVWGDAALTMTDGQIAGAELTATAQDTAGAALVYGAPNTDGLENVDVNGNAGVEVSVDGFIVDAAALGVAKIVSIISGDLGTGLMLPGVVLQYEIAVTNAAGAADATDVIVSDAIDPDLTFLTSATLPASAFTDIQVDDGGGPVECTSSNADNDGCEVVAGALVVGDPVDRPITISASGSYTVRFQVQIPDPATTP